MKKIFGITFVSLSTLLCANIVYAQGSPSEIAGAHYGKMSPQEQQERYEKHHKKSLLKEREGVKHKKASKELSGKSSGSSQTVSRINITGNKSITSAQLNSVISPYLKGGITSSKAETIKNAVEDYYNKQGYLLPLAYVQVNENSLSVRIIEGTIKDAAIIFNGTKKQKKELEHTGLIQLIEDIETVAPLTKHKLERYLLLIEKIHGYKVEFELVPLAKPIGDEVAGIIIKISTQKGKAGLSLDNQGLKELGKYEFMGHAQGYNLISNDSLIVNGGTSNKYERFKTISGGYLKRLTPYGTSLSVMGAYFTDDPYNNAGSKDSKSSLFYGRLDQYLALNNDYSVKLELKAEHRDVVYYASSEKARDYKYTFGSIGGKIKLVDFWDSENWFYPYYNWTLNNVSYSTSSKLTTPNFDKKFGYFILDWYRTQFIGDHFSVMMHGSYQNTNDKLPSEHMYYIGGPHTIKGYTPGLVSSDQGITADLEVRYNHDFTGKIQKFVETAQLFGFYGVTHFIKHNKDIHTKQHPGSIYFDKSTLQVIGAGVRVFLPYKFYGEYIAAQPLTKDINVDGKKRKNSIKNYFLISKDFTW